jgi:hypothetical protein
MNPLPLQFLVMTLAGWVNRSQQDVIEYLQEENRVLREHLGGRRSSPISSAGDWRSWPRESAARGYPESVRS